MNIYDFDKTIYDGDSTADFIFFCIKKYPAVLRHLIPTAWAYFLFIVGFYTKTQFKEKMYAFLKYIPDTDEAVKIFWKKNKVKIKAWYYAQKREDDIIISASPEFLLNPVCEDLKVRLMASKVDKKTGKYDGENCHGSEKVRRLYEKLPEACIEEFYSDSYSDTPLAEKAKKAFLVKGNKRSLWQEKKLTGAEKMKKMFFSGEFIRFVLVGVINTFNGVVFAWLYSYLIQNANLAFIIGYITSTVISYILNSVFTFRERLSCAKYVKFVVSYIPNFIIQNIAVIVFYNLLNWNKIIVYALAAVIGVPVTFGVMKIFKFGKNT